MIKIKKILKNFIFFFKKAKVNKYSYKKNFTIKRNIKNLLLFSHRTFMTKKNKTLPIKSSFFLRLFASWYLRFLIIVLGGWRKNGIYYPFFFISYFILFFILGDNFSMRDITVHIFAFGLYLFQVLPFLFPLMFYSEKQLDYFFFCYLHPDLYKFFSPLAKKINAIKFKKE